MYTLPHGHPTNPRVSGGAKAESEVESATISASVEGPATTVKKTRAKAKPKPEVVQDKDIVELDFESATPTEDDSKE